MCFSFFYFSAFFKVIFPLMMSVKKDRKEEEMKTVDVTFFLNVF